MAQDAAQRWNRTEGVLITPGTTPEEVAAFLNLHRVVARLEWYPSSTHLISITLMCDVEGRVAVTPPSRGGAVAGMGVGELAESLAREFGADATIGPASFDAMPEGVVLPEVAVPASPMSRTVVVSPLSAYTVPLQATLLERPLAVVAVPAIDRRIVMYSGQGADLGTYGWDEESLPAVLLTVDEQDMTVRALPTGDPDDDAVYSWAMTSRYVMGGVDEPGPALKALVDEVLTDRTDAAAIAAAVPGADEAKVAEAIAVPGIAGVEAMVSALGLPPFVSEVLSGRTAPAEVRGVVVHEPRGLSNAVGRSVGMLLQDPSTPGSDFWQGYVRTVTDVPWVVRLASVAEAGAGGALIGLALRRRSRTGSLSVGLVAAGAALLVDAVAETSLASWTRHRELRRRADEEMALVADELGA